MKHFWEDFTVIDFMGMFISGALFVLVTDDAPFPFKRLCIHFFGEDNPLALGIYFVIFSYMIGTFFIECSKNLEKLFCKKLVGSQYAQSNAYDENSQVKIWFCSLSQRPLFSDVKIAVQGKGAYRKRMLFSGFYELCRTLLIAIPACVLIRVLCGYSICILPISLPTTLPHAWSVHITLLINIIPYFVILYIIFCRMKRFLKYTIEYTYGEYYRLYGPNASHTTVDSDVDADSMASVP